MIDDVDDRLNPSGKSVQKTNNQQQAKPHNHDKWTLRSHWFDAMPANDDATTINYISQFKLSQINVHYYSKVIKPKYYMYKRKHT